MTVSWLQPPRALSCRATDSAVVLASITMLSPSRTSAAAGGTDALLLVGLEALADLERELRPAAVDGDRAAVGPDEPMLGFEHDEVLADRDRRHAELGREIGDPGTTLLLDDAGDVFLAFTGEDVARGGARWIGHASPSVELGIRARGFVGFRRTVDLPERNVKKAIEINRKMWQATRHGRNERPSAAQWLPPHARVGHPTRPATVRAPPPPASATLAPAGSDNSRNRRVGSGRASPTTQIRPEGRRRQT